MQETIRIAGRNHVTRVLYHTSVHKLVEMKNLLLIIAIIDFNKKKMIINI